MNIITFQPFKHSDYQNVKNFLDLARKQKVSIEGDFVAALVYINGIEYVAHHVHENLRCICHLVTKNELSGIIYSCEEIKKKNLTLGQTIDELEKYSFPSKEEFISNLTEFKRLRNKYSHNLLKTSDTAENKIQPDMKKIRDTAENIFSIYDIIVRGIIVSWSNYFQTRLIEVGNLDKNPEKGNGRF